MNRYPSIRLVSPIGEVGKIDVECDCLIKQYNIPARPYPTSLEASLSENLKINQNEGFVVDEETLAKRTDLRKMLIMTVDPADAKDLDDALSIEEVGPDLFEVGVHIADVSHFVRKDDYIDNQASKKSVTYYFPSSIYPMLPNILCETACSLNSNSDRLAFSVFFKMDSEGNRVEYEEGDDTKKVYRLEKTVINSSCKLSYEVA